MVTTICVAILAVAAAFHFYWGAGGELGRSVSLPQFADGRPISSIPSYGAHAVGLVLVASIAVVLAFGKQIALPLPWWLVRASMILLAVGFGARALSWHSYVGLFKKVRNTRFARYDTWLYSPLCLVLSFCLSLLVAAETSGSPAWPPSMP